ncbi:MAG: phosphomevalonate kinase [Erysipelotrichaceae bacterium]|nr:phosphomevalonate kinase [Erysipelotrichaceae bacterium]
MKAEGIGWGKLFLAGEYAVVQPGQPAIILATDRRIRVTIETSHQFCLRNINNQKEFVFDDLNVSDDYWKFAVAALNVFYRLLHEIDYIYSPVSVTVDSNLDSADGRKLGLGSSGAIVAAIIKGLNRFYQLNLDSVAIFKLCVISQSDLKVRGSYGDLAAAIYGGIIRYTRFDEIDMNGSISDLLKNEWLQLSISYLNVPFDLHWVVGWTGEPVSTQNRVDWVNEFRKNEEYIRLLDLSKKIVQDMIHSHDIEGFMFGIRKYRDWLNHLETITKLTIETPQIKLFIEICAQHHGSGKSSGAGGGDCAIAFFPHKVAINDILLSKGIMPLTMQIAKREVV